MKSTLMIVLLMAAVVATIVSVGQAELNLVGSCKETKGAACKRCCEDEGYSLQKSRTFYKETPVTYVETCYCVN